MPARPLKLIFIQPAIGHREGDSYLRTWQMEPLTLATLSGLTPPEVERSFYDDRLEKIPFDEKADAVILPVETYTARRAYEIASEFRKRGTPVIAGGFHATLAPEEAERYAEAVVVGEAEPVWDTLLEDIRARSLKKRYRATCRPALDAVRPDRSLYAHKRYLNLRLLETGRGCGNVCDFCAVQAFFGPTYRRRDIGSVVAELKELSRRNNRFFFVDDNFVGNPEEAKELLRAIIPLRLGAWATQISVNAAEDEDLLALMRKSGCVCVLVGFESLNPQTLRRMNKGVNLASGDFRRALANLRKHAIGVFATFVFGYDTDTRDSFEITLEFALEQGIYLAAFNHLIPFPGTTLYERLLAQGRMSDPQWWLNTSYAFNDVPFSPVNFTADELRETCFELRKRFYSLRNILRRCNGWSFSNSFLAKNYFLLNLLHRGECRKRNAYPLGDRNFRGELIEA